MLEYFKNWKPTSNSLAIVQTANEIINEYQAQGYTLTLRQLYYQFVARDLIENTIQSYKNLGSMITRGRLAGMISWEAIEDRNRECKSFWMEENPRVPIDDLPHYIRFDQWARQDTYVEVWVEKDALGAVVKKACDPLLVPHLACKGYLSASEAWRAGKRFEQARADGKHCVMIHLGDHDPSGIDMTRDNGDRLEMLSNESDVEVRRIALNMDQIEEYDPPPAPAKKSDSRSKEYIKKYGDYSWELDALEPSMIERIITEEINLFIDQDMWGDVRREEREVEKQLRKLGDNWEAVKEFLSGY